MKTKSHKLTALTIAAIVLIQLVLAVGAFGGTYAYLSYREDKMNTFTVGEVKTPVSEEYTPPAELTPGLTFTKKPYITNTGNLDCFVRMRVDFSDSKAGQPNNTGGFCSLNYNTTDWTYNGDDEYWYYKNIVKPGEDLKDHALFSEVHIDDAISPDDLINMNIMVYSESYQAGNHPATDYMTVWTS